MSQPAQKSLTIAESAKHLGMSETTLRRLLKTSPEYAARTLSERHRTPTGERSAVVLPGDLLTDIASQLAQNQTPPNAVRTLLESRQNAAGTQPEHNHGGILPEGRLSPVEAQLRVFYERLDVQRQEQIAELKAALEHERATTRNLTEALQREQSLRLLTAPSMQDTPPIGEGDTENVGKPSDQAQVSDSDKFSATLSRSWWARLFGREKR